MGPRCTCSTRPTIAGNGEESVLLNIGKCLMPKFLLRRGRFHGSHRADVRAFLSTGCHRGTRGEFHQIDCGVTIPIVDDATFLAYPLTVGEGQSRMDMPAI